MGPESILDTKTDDSYGAIGEVVGEAKSSGTLGEQRHEHAVLEFLGIASSTQKQQQKEQNGVGSFPFGEASHYPSTSQRTWADLANPAKNEPPMPSQKPTQKPMQKLTQKPTQKPGMNNDATFSGLFGARWGTF